MRRTNHGGTLGRARRGVAMLLVLIAMVVTVVLTGAAIVSRETSPTIGQNSTALAASAWSAESAANYAVGAIAQGFDWEGALNGSGDLIHGMVIGGAAVEVSLTDLGGNVPDSEDRDLIMTAVATIDGVSTTVRRMLSLGDPADPLDAIDPRLGEFAVLGTQELVIEPGARVGVWPLSPEAGARPQAKLGTTFAAASNLDVCVDDALGPVEMYVDALGSAGLLSEVEGTAYDFAWQMPVEVPVLTESVPGSVVAAMASGGNLEPAPGAVVVGTNNRNYGEILISNGSTVKFDGSIPTAIQCDRLELDDGELRVFGEVSIYVRDRVRLENGSSISLQDETSRLRLYVCGELTLDTGSQIGVMASDIGVAAGAIGTWVSPERALICEVGVGEGGSGSGSFVISNGSTVLGSVIAPHAQVTVSGASTVLGRLTGGRVRVGSGATVLYCPTLDNRLGFTNADGPLYVDAETVDPAVEAALADATSGASTTGLFTTLFTASYESHFELIGGALGEVTETGGEIVHDTVSLFTQGLGLE